MSWFTFTEGLLANAASSVLGSLVGFLWGRQIVPPVKIKAIRVSRPDRFEPRALIATFSGLSRPPEGMARDTFARALDEGDLEALPIDEDTPGIGHTVCLLRSYPSLERVFLVTTHSEGFSSYRSVRLIEEFVRRERLACRIDQRSVDLDIDNQVTEETHREVRKLIERLHQEGYSSKSSGILVDVTGGPRSMTVGALLACLGPQQNVHLVGTPYDEQGKFIKGESFPMMIEFKAKLKAKL